MFDIVKYKPTYTVSCVKRVESCFLHILVIISVILHAIHTKDISN